MAKKSETLNGEELRRNRVLLGSALGPLVMSAIAIAWTDASSLWPALGVVGLFATLWVWRLDPIPRRLSISMRIDDTRFELGDRRIARDDLVHGEIAERDNEWIVRLTRRRGRPLAIAMEKANAARKLVRALGLPVSAVTASYRAHPPPQASGGSLARSVLGELMITAIASVLVGFLSPAASLLAVFLGSFGLLVKLGRPMRVDVGDNGISLHWFGSYRFVAYADMRDIAVRTDGLIEARSFLSILLRDGSELRIRTAPKLSDGLEEAIREALIASRSDAPSHARLARGDRTHAQWVASLRAREAVDLRTPALEKTMLWPIIENAAADPIERAAAVVALGAALTKEERRRLERARAMAPKLRVMLEAAPEADEPELARLLEEVETEEAEQRARAATPV